MFETEFGIHACKNGREIIVEGERERVGAYHTHTDYSETEHGKERGSPSFDSHFCDVRLLATLY